MVSNTDTNTLFMPGVHAILSTGKPFLPKLLEIPEYWEQKAREEAEAERKRREEEAERHQAEMKAKWKEEEARQQERTKREVMKVLGITEKQLARIVEK